MNATIVRFGIWALALLLPAFSQAESVRIDYSEPLQQFELQRDTPEEMVRFNAFGKRFDVRLTPNQNVLSAAVRERLSDDIGVYRGAIDGMPGSWVRLVVADGVPRGMLWDGTEMYAIEPSKDIGGEPHMFRLKDVQIEPGTMTCGHGANQQTVGDLLEAVVNEAEFGIARAAGATSSLDMAVIADFEFASARGGAAEAAIATRINNVDGIFSDQLGVQINLARTDVFTSANDPFSNESDAGKLLLELRGYRESQASQLSNGLTHLFTGRDLDGTTVGIAYTGALCFGAGAGLTQGTHSASFDSLIAAHEIGHNFGAPHDGSSGSACESTSGDFLMAPRVNSSDTFSACSIEQMQDDVNRARCITALMSQEVGVVANQPANSLLGDSQTLTFVVNSTGTEAATNVDFTVSVPSSVTLDSISSTIGNCSSGGSSASCAIGTIAAGSNATVSLDVTSISPGDASFQATTSAPGDSSGSNNQATLVLAVDPATDLQLSAAAASVLVNQSTAGRITVTNQSSISATAVQVTINSSAGLRIDSATWPAGSCSVSSGIATCDAASLAANSSGTIAVQLTGTTTGTQSYGANISANETDRDSGNDTAQGQVTVTEAGAETQSDSGGGAFGLLELFGLLVLLMRKSRATLSDI